MVTSIDTIRRLRQQVARTIAGRTRSGALVAAADDWLFIHNDCGPTTIRRQGHADGFVASSVRGEPLVAVHEPSPCFVHEGVHGASVRVPGARREGGAHGEACFLHPPNGTVGAFVTG